MDKALLTIDGEAFLSRIARTMRSVFEHVIIISNEDTYRFLHLPVFRDQFLGRGPLAGIHSGLLHSKTLHSFIVACDLPFLSKELIEYVIDFPASADAKVPSTDNKLQPLCSLYSRQCLRRVEESVKSGKLKVQDLLTRLHTVVVPITPRLPFYRKDLLLNVNEVKDYELVTHSGESLSK